MMSDPNFLNRTLWIEDNLKVLRGINSECVDLIYLDPPFNSKRIYNAPLGSKAAGAKFDDTWSMDGVKSEWAELQEHADPAMYHAIVGAGLSGNESMQAYLSFMALRLQELHRVLKPSGSLYLHCDPTASHYVKQLLDVIFGRDNFRGEIVWKRTTAHSDAKGVGNVHDIIFHYSASKRFLWNKAYQPYSAEYIASHYRRVDSDGRRYRTDNVTAGGLSGGGYAYEWNGQQKTWRYPRERMQALHEANRLHYTRTGSPEYIRYLDEMPGLPLQSVWTDINPVNSQAKERTGWPTQKPLALLERIIEASSNPGDMVLDPFAGCATTCVAAELLGRQWAGIDIDSKALEVTVDRLQRQTNERNRNVKDTFGTDQLPGLARDETSGAWTTPEIIAADTPPKRTDRDAPTRSTRIRAIRWAELGDGDRRPCPGCGRNKFLDDFDLDHIIPRSKGGLDADDNLQLLCSSCNRLKGARTMSELKQMLGTT